MSLICVIPVLCFGMCYVCMTCGCLRGNSDEDGNGAQLHEEHEEDLRKPK